MSDLIDGTYLVQFRGPFGDVGGGVVTVIGNRVSGGDSGYVYTGQLQTIENVVRGEVAVVRHDPAAISVLGDLERFDVVLEGRAGEISAFRGCIKTRPELRIEVRLILQRPMAAA